MSRNPSISMTKQQQAFVERMIASGRYKGVSEVVRAGMRLLEEQEVDREARARALDALIDEGLNSGPPEPLPGVEVMLDRARARSRDT